MDVAQQLLADRHVVVTGGSSGIGAAFVRRALAAGARVSVIALDDDDLARLGRELPQVLTVGADVGDREQAYDAVGTCQARHGPCDVLVTCAGIVHPGYFLDIPDEQFERHLRVNFLGTLWPVRAVVPAMIERRRGTVVAVSSFAALLGVFGMSAYGPSKYAVRGLCEVLRLELRPYGIHVAGVYPTDVDTPMLARELPLHPPEQDAMQGKIKPMPPEAVVDAVLAGLRRGRTRIFPGRGNRLLAFAIGAAPEVTARLADRAIMRVRRVAASRQPTG